MPNFVVPENCRFVRKDLLFIRYSIPRRLFDNSVKTKRRERSRGTFYYQRPGLFQAALDIVGVILDYGRVVFLFEQRGGDQEVGR